MHEVIVEAHALKHGLSEEEIRYAWEHFLAKRPRAGGDYWVAIGLLPDGSLAELVAAELQGYDYLVFHAMTPVTMKVVKELGMGNTR